MFNKLFVLTLALCFICAGPVLGQDVTFPDIATLTPETVFTATVDPLYGMLVILSGYLTAFVPGLKKWAPFYRVLAFGLSLALALVLFRNADVWRLAFTYFISNGLYLIILKNMIKSPAAADG